MVTNSAAQIILSTSDLPAQYQTAVTHCEDCACPVTSNTFAVAFDQDPSTGSWVLAKDIFEISLYDDYRVLFNPYGIGGVTVVNRQAYEFLQTFRECKEWVSFGESGNAKQQNSFLRFVQLGFLHQANQLPSIQHNNGRSDTLTAWLHIIDACNLDCPYCYLDKSGERMSPETGRAAVDALIKSAVRFSFEAIKLKYAGGEATLDARHVIELHDYAAMRAQENGLRLEAVLLSNGLVFPPKLIEAIKQRKIRTMISLDGVGEDHDIQRPIAKSGQSSFAWVDKTIARLTEADLKPHISITITKRNVAGLAKVVRFVLERNLAFSLNFFRDNECASKFTDLQNEESMLIDAMRDAFNVIEEFLPEWSPLGCILDRGQLLQPRKTACGVGHDYVVINQHGQIAQCHMEMEKTLGDVFKHDPLQIVQEQTTTWRNIDVDMKEGCRNCSWRYWCSGGCAAATYKATGRTDIKSPNCNIYKAIYPLALRLEGLRLLKYAGSILS